MPTVVAGFIDAEEKENHFLDHSHEFNPRFTSAEAYEAAAIQFLTQDANDYDIGVHPAQWRHNQV